MTTSYTGLSQNALVDDFVTERIGRQDPLRSVDEWIFANPDAIVRTSISLRQRLETNPTTALKSVVAQIVLDDLQLLAPAAESAIAAYPMLTHDDAFEALMPTDAGRSIRERLLHTSLGHLAVERELFPSLQMLLPEMDLLVPVASRPTNQQSQSARNVLTEMHLWIHAQEQRLRIQQDFALARAFSHLPKNLVYLIHKIAGGDRPLETWRLKEQPVSAASWLKLQDLRMGRRL